MVMKALRRSLLATTIIAGTLAHAPARAQTAPNAAAATAGEAEADIIVTGSLITNPNLTSSSPVAAIGSDELQLRQTTVVEQVLREIPGVVPGIGQQTNNGQTSQGSTVNLRGLGSQRNIVLIDGGRIVPSDAAGSVDLNNIPVALLDRLDVLTGGASTTYGADAVSGVVNFITKRDFAGMNFQLGTDITEKGDGNRLPCRSHDRCELRRRPRQCRPQHRLPGNRPHLSGRPRHLVVRDQLGDRRCERFFGNVRADHVRTRGRKSAGQSCRIGACPGLCGVQL